MQTAHFKSQDRLATKTSSALCQPVGWELEPTFGWQSVLLLLFFFLPGLLFATLNTPPLFHLSKHFISHKYNRISLDQSG